MGRVLLKFLSIKKKNVKLVSPSFALEIDKKDANILYQIKAFFDVGSIAIRKSNGQVIYTVASVKDLMEVIIPHFIKYPLLTKKKTLCYLNQL